MVGHGIDDAVAPAFARPDEGAVLGFAHADAAHAALLVAAEAFVPEMAPVATRRAAGRLVESVAPALCSVWRPAILSGPPRIDEQVVRETGVEPGLDPALAVCAPRRRPLRRYLDEARVCSLQVGQDEEREQDACDQS